MNTKLSRPQNRDFILCLSAAATPFRPLSTTRRFPFSGRRPRQCRVSADYKFCDRCRRLNRALRGRRTAGTLYGYAKQSVQWLCGYNGACVCDVRPFLPVSLFSAYRGPVRPAATEDVAAVAAAAAPEWLPVSFDRRPPVTGSVTAADVTIDRSTVVKFLQTSSCVFTRVELRQRGRRRITQASRRRPSVSATVVASPPPAPPLSRRRPAAESPPPLANQSGAALPVDRINGGVGRRRLVGWPRRRGEVSTVARLSRRHDRRRRHCCLAIEMWTGRRGSRTLTTGDDSPTQRRRSDSRPGGHAPLRHQPAARTSPRDVALPHGPGDGRTPHAADAAKPDVHPRSLRRVSVSLTSRHVIVI